MPGARLQVTRVLAEHANRAEVHRVAEPAFDVETAADASDDAVAAVEAFFAKHRRDVAAYKMSPRRSRRIESGISVLLRGTTEDVVVHVPASASRATATRRLAAALAYEPMHAMQHQRVAAREWADDDGAAPQTYMLYFSMGSGKTFATLHMLAAMRPAPPRRVLVVCSNTMIGHWLKEVRRSSQGVGETTFDVVGYTEFRRLVGTQPARFVARRYDVVVVDEAHYYRNLTPAMRADVSALRHAKRLVLLTGTPIQNDVSEVAGLLVLLGLRGDESLAVAEAELARRRAVFYYDPSVHGSAYTQSSYPTLDTHVVRVPMAPEQTLEYLMSLRKNTRIGSVTVSTARCNAYNALTRAISNTIGGSDSAAAPTALSPKFARIVHNITSGAYRGPHVVYSCYRPKGVEAVDKALASGDGKQHALRTALMTGSTAARERDALIADYNAGKIDVFFITDAAREGIDLQGTGTMHLVEPHENVHSEMQTRARVARHNSHAHLPPDERRVTIVKYVSTFPTLRAADRRALEQYFEREYQLRADDFDLVAEVQRLAREAGGETVDEQYERQNVAKARAIRPWIDMLQRVGTRKAAIGAGQPPSTALSDGATAADAAAAAAADLVTGAAAKAKSGVRATACKSSTLVSAAAANDAAATTKKKKNTRAAAAAGAATLKTTSKKPAAVRRNPALGSNALPATGKRARGAAAAAVTTPTAAMTTAKTTRRRPLPSPPSTRLSHGTLPNKRVAASTAAVRPKPVVRRRREVARQSAEATRAEALMRTRASTRS